VVEVGRVCDRRRDVERRDDQTSSIAAKDREHRGTGDVARASVKPGDIGDVLSGGRDERIDASALQRLRQSLRLVWVDQRPRDPA